MQITGPTQLLFADGSGQQNLSLAVAEATGSVQLKVTEIPTQTVSIRKTAAGAPLAVGAALTLAEAAALVATRTAGAASYGPTLDAAAVVGVRTRVFATGSAAPAFTVGDAGAVQAVKDGNFWIPNFPTGGSGTLTVEMLFDIGSAITLGKILDTVISLGYGGATSDQWTGIVAKALASTDGNALSILSALSVAPDTAEPNSQKRLSGTVTGAPSGRWVGVRLENVPINYPLIFRQLGAQAATGSAFTALPSPVTFKVQATESRYGASTCAAAVAGVRSRVFASGTAAPAFTVGDQGAIDAVRNGHFALPTFPTGGSGTLTVDILIDVGAAITMGKINSIMSLGYTGAAANQWTGVAARAIASTDGIAVSLLNTLTIASDTVEPNNQKRLAGTVTNAPSARWVGVRLTNVPVNHPCIFRDPGVQPVSVVSTDDHAVAIGDSSTNFGGGTQPSGNATIYGDPGTRFPLGIFLREPAASYTLTIPSGLSLVTETTTPTTVTSGSSYSTSNATGPFSPTQTAGGASNQGLAIYGTGKSHDGTYLTLQDDAYVATGALGLSFPTSSDASKHQAPNAITLNFSGIIPADSQLIASVFSWGEGGLMLFGNWATNNVRARIERNGVIEEYESASVFSNSALEHVSVRYADNPSGPGGTVTFFRNGVQVGTPQATGFKARVTPAAALECNALTGNTAAGGLVKLTKLGLTVDLPSQSVSYTPVASGTVSAAQLQSLYVDALAVSAPQAARTVTYQPAGGAVQALDVVIGPMAVPAGAAYRAVLEDWSSGAAVSHPNVLVMTKPVRQNCRFEDASLHDMQAAWTECLPQGPVPVIGNIAYYCEAIRSGSYVQFQFGYDWTAAAMPSNPFGDPSGLNSYMVPHKWRIEDQSGAVVGRVERPDGGPLNGTDIPRVFSGSFDGYGVAITNATDKWYPHGTVRSAVIWRSSTPPAYSQASINSLLPRYDLTVPYASHTHYSNNGGDMRIFSDGQANGFGNTRVMPFLPTNYAALTQQVGVTQDPYKASLYNFGSLAAVASTWLKYTPFNQAGRSPTTGPGGVRDDRAAIAEPVAQYMYDVTAKRPHDQTPFATIALDYLTSYASDAFHCFEGGRCVPLYKGSKAGRTITLRNHYYGGGEASTPAERAYYVQGGRAYELASGFGPLRVYVPEKGSAPDKPYFGLNQIDAAHAHQYPHWGSMLWQTPEFAFLGHKLWDQTRLYQNVIIGESYAVRWADREGAWAFLHAVLAWKTASANSDRLYSRADVMDFVKKDFETFSDMHKTSNPGFDNPPTNVFTNGGIDGRKVAYAGASRFGIILPISGGFGQHDFMVGYWLTALGIGEKLGFNAALRASSVKAGAVLDWLIAKHRQRIVGRINQAPRVNLSDGYLMMIWKDSSLSAASGNVASLPQNYAAVATQNGSAPSWDTIGQAGSESRDGQATDQLLAGPSILKRQLGLSGSDIDTALSTATGWRDQKKNEQLALGADAGSTWFKYLNAVNNPALN